MPEQTDVLIVGAGPIGLELAVALKHAGAEFVQLDAGQVGHTITWYPRGAHFFSSPDRIAIAGVPLVTPNQVKATGEQYLAYLRSVVQQFDLAIRTFEKVVHLGRDGDGFDVRTVTRAGEQRQLHAKRIVLAIGDMHAPNRIGIEGEDLPHVSHYFRDPHDHFGQRLLIVGGRNSAVEAALRCHRIGCHVSLSYRGDPLPEQSIKYWLLPEIKSLIKHERVRYFPKTAPMRITPTHVVLQSIEDDEAREVEADSVLLLTGYQQDPTLFDQLGVERDGVNDAPVLDEQTQETSVPGVYVAGTAAAGTQRHFRLFIENAHPHVTRIVQALTGSPPPPELVNDAVRTYGLAES